MDSMNSHSRVDELKKEAKYEKVLKELEKIELVSIGALAQNIVDRLENRRSENTLKGITPPVVPAARMLPSARNYYAASS